MSLTTPTTTEIKNNIIAQLEATLNQTIPLLPKSFNRVLANALSGLFILLYKYGGFMFLQIFVSTASTKETTINGKTVIPLIEWGRQIGVGDPTAGTQAEMIIDVTVENQTGSLPTGTQLINAANGVTYITLGAVLLDAATVQATIRAVSDQAGGGGIGIIGNLNVADVVSFANPIANVLRNASVASIVVTAANAENLDTVYRQRVLDRWQKRLQGGAYSDYEAWGEEVAGIVNIYPYTGNNPGQVDVYVEATVASSGDPDGIPTTAQLQAVLDSINTDSGGLATRRPANALANTIAITRTGFDVTVFTLVVDNLATVQATIDAAVIEYLLTIAPYVDGLTVPPRLDRITQSALIGLVEDIVSANNGTFSTVTFQLTGVPGGLDSYVVGQGEKAKLETSVAFI